MAAVLVTGANRGIGLEFVRQYQAAGWRVHAACRKPETADALKALGPAAIHRLDVTEAGEIEALGRALDGEAIDVLINNAGIIGPRGLKLGTYDFGAWAEVMRVNVLAPVAVSEGLMANVRASGRKQVVAVSSLMGSIGRAGASNEAIYRTSKAALNMAMKCVAIEAATDGVTVLLFHPGHVRTDMGGPTAPVLPEASVKGMRATIERARPSDSGKFFNYDGAELPW